MKLLLIEDDDDKRIALEDFLRSMFSAVTIGTVRSFSSGLRQVINPSNNYDVVLMDMSMPNYDVTADEPSGGNPEPFAGRELLSQMQLRGISIPTIVVTMFDSFGDKGGKMSLEQLKQEMEDEFSPIYRGTVYYDSRQEGWKSALQNLIISSLGKEK
jgi:CheY-like chemotaxis protein